MSAWTDEELRRFGAAQELDIALVRRYGELRSATPIWVVRAGDDLYVRAAYGANKGWHGVARTGRRARTSPRGGERGPARRAGRAPRGGGRARPGRRSRRHVGLRRGRRRVPLQVRKPVREHRGLD